MEVSGIITAIVIGAIIGALGRLVVPGKQKIGFLWTIGVGILAALIGTALAGVLGVAVTPGIDWIELFLQVGIAGLGVSALAAAKGRSAR
jgi:uncharacterized membrane protein YeaQ/YmgE (transglycosylase-associated protein family)